MSSDNHVDPLTGGVERAVFEETDSSDHSVQLSGTSFDGEVLASRGRIEAAEVVEQYFASRGGLEFAGSPVCYHASPRPYVLCQGGRVWPEGASPHSPEGESFIALRECPPLPVPVSPEPTVAPHRTVELGAVGGGAAGTASVDLLNVLEVIPRSQRSAMLQRGAQPPTLSTSVTRPQVPSTARPIAGDGSLTSSHGRLADEELPAGPLLERARSSSQTNPATERSNDNAEGAGTAAWDGNSAGEAMVVDAVADAAVASRQALGALVERLANGSIPPLRAHVYYEEEHGAFTDHVTHAALAEKASAQAAFQAWVEEKRRKDANRWARYYRSGADGKGSEDGGRGVVRWARVEDAASYRAWVLGVIRYMPHTGRYIAAFACGAAVLTLIACALPPPVSPATLPEHVLHGTTEAVPDDGPGTLLGLDGMGLLVVLLHHVDPPLFFFLSVLLLLIMLTPVAWGMAEAHWQRTRKRQMAAFAAHDGAWPLAGGRGGAGSASTAMALRRYKLNEALAGAQKQLHALSRTPSQAAASATMGTTTTLSDVAPSTTALPDHTVRGRGRTPPVLSLTPESYELCPRISFQTNVAAYQQKLLASQLAAGGGGAYHDASSLQEAYSTHSFHNQHRSPDPAASMPTFLSDAPIATELSGMTEGTHLWNGDGNLGHSSTLAASVLPRNLAMNASASGLPLGGGQRGNANHTGSFSATAVGNTTHTSFSLPPDGPVPVAWQTQADTLTVLPANPVARSMSHMQSWLAQKVLGDYYFSQVVVLLQPRLWCLVVVLAATLAEFALLEDRTSLDLLLKLSPRRAGEEEASRGYQRALMAVFVVRATMLLFVWLFDMFF